MGKGGSGCAALFVIIFVIAVVVWAAAIAFWLFGGFTVLASILIVIFGIIHAWSEVGRKKESAQTAEVVELMALDCAQDLRRLQYRWAEIVTTRGIGTQLEDELRTNPALAEDRSRQIEAMIVLLEQAPATEQRLEAISQAEGIRHDLQSRWRNKTRTVCILRN